jgi:hypothetical protein
MRHIKITHHASPNKVTVRHLKRSGPSYDGRLLHLSGEILTVWVSQAGMSMLCTMPLSAVPRQIAMSNTLAIKAQDGRGDAQAKISALAQALHREQRAAFVR